MAALEMMELGNITDYAGPHRFVSSYYPPHQTYGESCLMKFDNYTGSQAICAFPPCSLSITSCRTSFFIRIFRLILCIVVFFYPVVFFLSVCISIYSLLTRAAFPSLLHRSRPLFFSRGTIPVLKAGRGPSGLVFTSWSSSLPFFQLRWSIQF